MKVVHSMLYKGSRHAAITNQHILCNNQMKSANYESMTMLTTMINTITLITITTNAITTNVTASVTMMIATYATKDHHS